jgi:hypothetical protein
MTIIVFFAIGLYLRVDSQAIHFMGTIKLIAGALGTLLAVYALLSSIQFYTTVADSSVRIAQGDNSATKDLADATADEVSGTVQRSLVMWVIIAIAGIIGVPGSIMAVLKRNS